MINREKTCFGNAEPPQRRSAVQSTGWCSGLAVPTQRVREGRMGSNRDGKQGEERGEVGCGWCRVRGCWKEDALREQLCLSPHQQEPQVFLRQQLGCLSGWTAGLWWVAFPSVAGCWPCAGHLGLCSEAALTDQRVKVGVEELRAVAVQRIARVGKQPRSSPVAAQPSSVPGGDTGVPGRGQPRCVTR